MERRRSDRRSENLGQKMIPSDRRSEKCQKLIRSDQWSEHTRHVAMTACVCGGTSTASIGARTAADTYHHGS